MKSPKVSRLSNRVLKLNVGFLLSDGPGYNHQSKLDIPTPIQLSDDLIINAIEGDLRLSRTKEGILVQADLQVNVDCECSRCLEIFPQNLELDLAELYSTIHTSDSEFIIHADAILDLAPLLRAETLILTSHRTLCSTDCKGLCPECGENRNKSSCSCDMDIVDPRLAALKQLLDQED